MSVFDFLPFQMGPTASASRCRCPARPILMPSAATRRPAWGSTWTSPRSSSTCSSTLGIHWVCTTAGSPYYNPHVQRPAAFPPSDGYLPPEDPLVGVARQIAATAELKARHPASRSSARPIRTSRTGCRTSASAVVRDGGADFIGLGRMVLSYPELPADVLAGRPLARKRICRTFSDCTTAPRNGIVSGCFPLDPFYKDRPEAEQLAELKRSSVREGGTSRQESPLVTRCLIPGAICMDRSRADRRAVGCSA